MMMRTFPGVLGVLVTLVASLALPEPGAGQVEATHFAAIQGRSIGPAGMSGRVTAVDVVLSDPNIIFVGSATGGVWRSRDGGLEWEPVFDDQPVLGIGAVAVFQANPDVVWVGTGEGNPRNSAGVGRGVFKSIDGGDSWRSMGLEGSERIHRIIPHPTDPNVAYVGAMGPAWSAGEQRGVFKTTDGGQTWNKILYVNDRTGAADLVMDPGNPDKLFAAMWQFGRDPWFFESGGEGSGLYVTYDGGATWDRLTEEDGLPDGPLGRIGLGIAPSNPDVVYALVEAERSELLRSDDGGRSWTTISDRPGVVPRPFYYADLRVDPANENRIYSLHSQIQVSEDQGKSFRTIVPSRTIHGDVHELWIDPSDGRHMIMGNDGGIGITRDRGERWRFVENLTLAQFYHVSVDMEVPFNVYGGLQDNGSWYGPSTVWEQRGIMNAHWRRTGGGDGFASYNDFGDDRFGYSLSQRGNLRRFDKVTGARQNIQPVHPEGVQLRFNWNAALNIDPFDSTTIYLGSQFVHRSVDHGRSWDIMSPDLTTDDPEKQRQDRSGGLTLDATGAENHTTILSISPSPLQPGLIWVSTDDGNVQVTEDGGRSWSEVGHGIPGVPGGTWVPHVEPSFHDAATAYVVLEDHRRGNWEPYAFVTRDLGKSWKALNVNDIFGFIHVIREDPVEPNLLFIGTEFGLYFSLDRGGSWLPWRHGVPPAPVRDLRIHPRDHDLVIATHGRGIYIVDDIRPLRALAGDTGIAGSPLYLFEVADAQKYESAEAIGYRSVGHAMQFGENRPYGALINYWVGPANEAESADIDLINSAGDVIRTLSGSADPGVNRVVWNLRADGEGTGEGGEVLAGTFTVRIRLGDHAVEGTVAVLEDPRVDLGPASRMAKVEALERAQAMTRTLEEAQRRLDEAGETLEVVLGSLEGRDGVDGLRDMGQALVAELDDALESLFTGPECQGICGRSGLPAGVVRAPARRLGSSDGAPTPNELVALRLAETALGEILDQVNRLFAGPVADFSARLLGEGYSPFPVLDPLTVQRRTGGG